MQVVGNQSLEIEIGVLGRVHVDLLRCRFPATEVSAEILASLVFFQRDYDLLARGVRELSLVGFSGGAASELAAAARTHLGLRAWSRLYPDIGGGTHASLATRRIYLRKLFLFIVRNYARGRSGARPLDVLAEIGREGWPSELPSFFGFMNVVHFPPEKDLPTPEDFARATEFASSFSAALAEVEQGLIKDPRFRPKSKKPRTGKAGNPVAEMDKRLRRFAEKFMGPGTRDQVWDAVVLMSYEHRARLSSWLARQVVAGLPEGTLDPLSRRLFDLMWISAGEMDGRGRFPLPLMGSPPAASVLEYFGGFGSSDPRATRNAWILTDLLAFAAGGPRNRAVDVALGLARVYQPWLDQEREWNRDKKSRERHPMLALREEEG